MKKVRLQTLRRQYELMQMESNEKIAEYFNRVITRTNAMKGCGKKMKDRSIVEKILRTLNPRFDHIVVTIEETKKIEEMKVKELQRYLEAHEQRLLERESEKPNDNQVLLAQTSKKTGNNSRDGFRGRGRGRNSRGGYGRGGQNQDQEKGNDDHSNNRQQSSNGWRGGKRKTDRKRIKCFDCN